MANDDSIDFEAEIVMKKFPIVCVGGSAGGLDAYIRLLQNLRATWGWPLSSSITSRSCPRNSMKCCRVSPRCRLISSRKACWLVEPDHVFIIPANRDLHVDGEEFHLEPISKPRGWPDVITVFLRSLTEHWDGKLIAVIVSGYDGDGADALWASRRLGALRLLKN